MHNTLNISLVEVECSGGFVRRRMRSVTYVMWEQQCHKRTFVLGGVALRTVLFYLNP